VVKECILQSAVRSKENSDQRGLESTGGTRGAGDRAVLVAGLSFLQSVLEAQAEALTVPSGPCCFFSGVLCRARHRAFPARDLQNIWREMVVLVNLSIPGSVWQRRGKT